MQWIVPPSIFFQRGMLICKHSFDAPINKTNLRKFRAHFGTSPGVCALLWNRIQPNLNIPGGASFLHLLWALLFMKTYGTEENLSSKVKVDEKSYREKIWPTIVAISGLKDYVVSAICVSSSVFLFRLQSNLTFGKIKFSNRLMNQNGSCCLMSVDGTDFQILEPNPFWRGWFSHKFKGPGLRYEVAICIQTGWIVWVNGPFAAGHWNDVKIFKGWLKQLLYPGEKVEADNGYPDEKVSRPDQNCSNYANYLCKADVRGRHETVNRRFKQFQCLKQVFRHDKQKHVHCFNAVAVITQLLIENGEPLYQVYYRSENNN